MVEEEKKTEQQTIQSADDYAAAIEALKARTVDKDTYEKVVEDNKVLIKALAGEGPVPEGVQTQAQKPDVNELRKKFLNAGDQNLSNAEYIKTALELRQAVIDEGGIDPFLPIGAKTTPTPTDIAGANKVADMFQSMLEAATDDNGKVDDELFNAYLKKNIAEDSPMITARLKASKMVRK